MGLRHPPPGKFYPLGTHRLHADFHAGPPGVPAVILDAALGGSSLGWVFVERAVRAFAPTLAYDRAGLGWSDAGPLPRDLPRLTAELSQLLPLAAPPPPYVLVGHSFGALVVRHFAAQFPERVAGLVLVDPPSLEEWAWLDAEHRARLDAGIRLCRRGYWAARCGAARVAAALIGMGALRAAAWIAAAASGLKLRRSEETFQNNFNFTPAILLPADAKPVMRWFWTRPSFYQALASQMEALPGAARTLAQAPPLGDIPLAVLSAANAPAAQLAEHRRQALQSRRGRHLQARASGHWIPLEEPEMVIAAVRAVLEASAEIRYDSRQSGLRELG